MSRRLLYTLSLLYLSLPVAIFAIGWLPPVFGLPLAAVALWATWVAYRRMPGRISFGCPVVETVMVCALLCVVIYAGIGGLTWQMYGDHDFRNTVFANLVDYSWPVTQGGEMLCYYFGFWLPAALTGKLCGSLLVGRLMQVVWAAAGLWFAVRLLFDAVGSTRLRVLWVFLFFGGVEIVPFLLYVVGLGSYTTIREAPEMLLPNLSSYSPIAWWNNFHVSLYYIYNQLIPGFIGTLLVAGRGGRRSIPLVVGAMLISAPFPAVGLLPAAVWLWAEAGVKLTPGRPALRWFVSPQLVCALLLAIPVALFFMANRAAAGSSLYGMDGLTGVAKFMVHVAIFVGFQALVWLPFIWRMVRSDVTFWILLATAVSALVVRTGEVGFDFASRVSLPFLTYICICVCRYVDAWRSHARRWRMAFVTVGVLALCGPLCEAARTACKMLLDPQPLWYKQTHATVFEFEQCRNNFVSPAASWIKAAADSTPGTAAPSRLPSATPPAQLPR